MASSGSFNTTAYSGRYLTFSWSEKSQDIAKNQTTITWTLKGAGGSSTWYMAGAFKLIIDGKTAYSSSTRIQLANGTQVASGTHTFTHANDGTKKFTASAEAGIYTYAVNCTGSGTFTLDTIARASQPSCITWPDHTQNVGNFGDTISIHMNRKSDSFTHTVRYAFGTTTGTIATGVTTGTTWQIPKSLMNKIPNTLSGSGTIHVDTYNGSTLIGTKSCGFTASVPTTADCYPTCKLTYDDVTGWDDTYGAPVQGLSVLNLTLTSTQAYSSPIASRTITADGTTYNSATASTGVLKKAGNALAISATVKDKRGRPGSWSGTMKVLAYTAPKVSKLTVHRCNADGTSNDQGDHIRVVFSAAVTSLGSKNLAYYTLRIKKTTASDYDVIPLTDLSNAYTVTDEAYVYPADEVSSYDIEVEAQDRHGTATRITSASTAFSLIDWGADGTSMAVGKLAEVPHVFDMGIEALFSGGFYPNPIPNGADLNNYKTSGFYRCRMSVDAESLLNCPTNVAFTLEILHNAPTTQRLTEYVETRAPRVFIRNYYEYVDKWGDWYEMSVAVNRMGNAVNLTNMGASEVYTFQTDGYLVLRAHYTAGTYMNATLCGTNGVGIRLSVCTGTGTVANPTETVFVRRGMYVTNVGTNDATKTGLHFYSLY